MAKAKTQPAPEPAAEDTSPDMQLLAVKTMAGDVRDFLLDRMKHEHDALPWHMRGEDKQRATIEAATAAAERLVRRVAYLIATQDRPAIGAHVKKAALKDVIAVELHVGLTHPLRHALLDAVGTEVVIVLSGAEECLGARGAVKVSRDQAAMFGDDEVAEE